MRPGAIVTLWVCALTVATIAVTPGQNRGPKTPAPRSTARKPELIVVRPAQYDNAPPGSNLLETILKPQNVNASQFGRVASFLVDGDVYAQPLYVPQLEIPGKGLHNVLFVVTEKDSVYAIDADATSTSPLWHVNFAETQNISPVSARDVQCPFIQPDIGITSTPVIDVPSKTLYPAARTKESSSGDAWAFRQKLNALDLASGTKKFGGPVTIRASYQGEKSLFSKGVIEFDARRENQRAALLLANGNVFITWASSCDVGPYYGWVMAYDARTLKQTGVLNVAPSAKESGIWQADAGPAADNKGNVYLITGNGKFTAASGGLDYGDSVLKIALTPIGLAVRDYFTPADQEHLNDTDGDFGSGSPLLLPDHPARHSHLFLAAGKSAKLYELDRDQLGHFHAGDDSNAVQVVPAGAQSFGAPAYWNGHVFYFLMNDYLRDYVLQNGRLSMQPAAKSTTNINDPGTPAISANGSKNGIVWILSTKVWNGSDQAAILFAYDATKVSHELYKSTQNPERDRAGNALRFTIPTIANGRVYVPTKRRIDVYGLLSGTKSKGRCNGNSRRDLFLKL